LPLHASADAPPAREMLGRHHGHDALTKAMEATSLNLVANQMEEEENVKVGFDWFGLAIICIQMGFIILFFVFCRYTQADGTPYGFVASNSTNATTTTRDATGLSPNNVVAYWQFLRDVGVMMLIGFGYLMTFLKRHRFSSIGYTFFIVVIAVQWNILIVGFYTYVKSRPTIDIATQINVGFPELVQGESVILCLLIT
jgi:hypothetical protein